MTSIGIPFIACSPEIAWAAMLLVCICFNHLWFIIKGKDTFRTLRIIWYFNTYFKSATYLLQVYTATTATSNNVILRFLPVIHFCIYIYIWTIVIWRTWVRNNFESKNPTVLLWLPLVSSVVFRSFCCWITLCSIHSSLRRYYLFLTAQLFL